MLTPQEWIDNGTVVFEDNIITNAGEGKAPIEGAFRTIVLKADIALEDAIKMSSLTPARIMHVDDRKGFFSFNVFRAMQLLEICPLRTANSKGRHQLRPRTPHHWRLESMRPCIRNQTYIL
ncbi:MAG: hypothetical protein PUD83_02590 [Bacteroidales bacterium]|nr:hypothetical protein [Bacteroidales bacterium]